MSKVIVAILSKFPLRMSRSVVNWPGQANSIEYSIRHILSARPSQRSASLAHCTYEYTLDRPEYSYQLRVLSIPKP